MPQRAALANLHWLKDLDDDLPGDDGTFPDHADVVIVGGGYVGSATAYWLTTMGAGAVVVERRGVATGASGRNAGFISPGLGEPFADSVARFGRAGAIERLNFTRAGRDLALALIEQLGIDCELERSGSLNLPATDDEWQTLRASGTALRHEGFAHQLLSREELGDQLCVPVPERYPGGLYNPETLLVNPAKLARGVAVAARRQGARFFGDTEVHALSDCQSGIIVGTSRGDVTAGRVVLATNAWSPLLAGFFRERIAPVRGQVFATEPAPPTFKRAMSTNAGYEYWSQRKDGVIVLGGGRWAVPDRDEGYYAEEVNPVIQQALYDYLTETFPSLKGVAVARRWAGIMGFSRDGYPFIGAMPGRERLLVAAGYTGHGGPYFAVAGRCVAETIVHGKSELPLTNYALDRPLP